MFAPHPDWKTLRTLALHCLREDGMGREALEPQIAEEIEHYIDNFIRPNHDSPIDTIISLPQATSNVICQLLFNKRFDYDDEKFQSLVDTLNSVASSSMRLGLIANVPFQEYIFRFLHEAGDRHFENFVKSIREIVDDKKKQLDLDNPVGVLDNFLIRSQSEEENQKNTPFRGMNMYLFKTKCMYCLYNTHHRHTSDSTWVCGLQLSCVWY